MRDYYDEDSIVECYKTAMGVAGSDQVKETISARLSTYMDQSFYPERRIAIGSERPNSETDFEQGVNDCKGNYYLPIFASEAQICSNSVKANKYNENALLYLQKSGPISERITQAIRELDNASNLEPNNPRTKAIKKIVEEIGHINSIVLENQLLENQRRNT